MVFTCAEDMISVPGPLVLICWSDPETEQILCQMSYKLINFVHKTEKL